MKKTKKGNQLNMAIAKTHRLSTRLVGMQITSGTFIGMVLSSIQMSAGFIVVGQSLIQGNAYLAILVALIGIALAILVERLSLGGLSAIRVITERLHNLEDTFYAALRAEKREATDTEKADQARLVKGCKSERWTATLFAGLGMVLSAGVGDVFWHELFAGMGWMGYVLSTACALVISLTFLHSEIYKGMIDGVLRDILIDLSLMKTAVAAEGQVMQVDMLVGAFDAIREDAGARVAAQKKIERTVVRSLSGYADAYERTGSVIVEAAPVGAIGHGQQALLPAPKGKYMQNRDELRRLFMGNPSLTQREVAAHFTISRSTAGEWLKKIKAGN